MIEPRHIPGHPGMMEQPSVVSPSEEEKPSLYCFLASDRVCGPDCVAFNTSPPREQDYVGQHFANCHLLINAHRAGKHLVILAAAATKMHQGVAQQAMPSPPIPR